MKPILSLLLVVLVVFMVSTNRGSIYPIINAHAQSLQQSVDDNIPPDVGSVPQQSLANEINNETTRVVYFAPQDNNGNATVVVLYNTGAANQTVNVTGYNENGFLTVNQNVNVSARGVVRLISDPLVASPPSSWSNSVMVNFSDFTTYAVITLPRNIKFDGYIIFNSSTGTINPSIDQGAIPLRFSTDPLDVFLPSIQRNP